MMRLALSFVLLLPSATLRADEVPLQPGTVIRFATVAQGKQVLMTRDSYVAAQSPFDRAARMRTDRDVTEDEYLEYVGAQVRAWEADEVAKLSAIIASVQSKTARFKLPLPETILLVKTTGLEEGNAAYCRADAIVLPQRYVDRPVEQLENTLIHELFHVLSRNNPQLRERLYGIVGFRRCGKIALPESLRSRKITNPDAVEIEYAIRVTFDGEPLDVTPVLYSSAERYDVPAGGPFFRYLTFRLMAIQQHGDHWEPKQVDGEPQMLKDSEVSGFYEQIGRNTTYIIHPEEVLAENFVLVVNKNEDVPTPRILHEIEKRLAKESRN